MIARLRRLVPLAALVVAVLAAACEKVPLLAPSGSTITLTSSATTLPSNGTTQIIAQVLEPSGTPPHSGTHVTFTTTLGTVQPADAVTDTGGRAIVTFNAGAASGTATITAISGGAASTNGSNTVKIAIGTAAVGRVNVGANPTAVPSTGGTSTISASILDINGNALPNAPVAFTTTAGSLSNGLVLTDQNGIAQTTLTTSQQATVTASVGAAGGSTGGGTGGGGTTPGAGGGTTTPPTAGQASGTVTVTVQNAPTLVITPPTTAPTAGLGSAYTFAVTAATSNGCAIRNLTVNWGDGQTQDLGAITGNAVVQHVYTRAGSYTITATLTDACGNTNNISTGVTVNATQLPITITPPTTAPSAGLPGSFTIVIGTLPAGDAVKEVVIDWGDGTQQNLGAITSTTTISHVYATAGSYTVTARVTDTVGNTNTVSTSVSVVATGVPVVNITPPTVPANATLPYTATFTIQVTPPTGVGIQSATINWGDGSQPEQIGGINGTITKTHAYNQHGTFPVSVTVTDTLGRSTTGTTTITIP